MSTLASSVTPCSYLFGQEAEALFPKEKPRQIDRMLRQTMKIVDFLAVAQPEGLFLFDPTAFNNQCHLYALFTTQVIRQLHTKRMVKQMLPSPLAERVVEELELPIDERFLYLSFFLSYAFLTDAKLLEKLVAKTLKRLDAPPMDPSFQRFLRDQDGIRTKAARLSLNKLFEEQMKKGLAAQKSPLYEELMTVAQADLQLAPSSGPNSGKGSLYTFPKFAGVVYLIDALAREKIPLVFKVKVITLMGTHSFSYSTTPLEEEAPTDPVIVFEMVAPGPSLNYLTCRDLAKQCPSHSRRNVSRKQRHAPETSCIFCTPKKIDVAPYREKFEPVFQRAESMLLALGADFVLHHQEKFLPLFYDSEAFPQLSHLFQQSLPEIQKCFLSMSEPSNLSVSHVYVDSASRAKSEALLLDAAYETHLSERGLV